MAHEYNKNAFRAGANAASPLLALYCSLIIIELRFKDHVVPRPIGHRMIEWLASLGEASLAQQLRTALARLICTDRTGNPAPVEGNSYPDVRYLRHVNDYSGTSTDAQINDALSVVVSINAALQNRRVP